VVRLRLAGTPAGGFRPHPFPESRERVPDVLEEECVFVQCNTKGVRGMKMPHVRLRRPSPAIVIACIALAVALTPASYAAVSQLLPANSVGTTQLQNDAVTSNKVRDFSLRKWDFKKGDLQSLIGDMTVRQSSISVPPGPVAHNGLYVTRVIQVKCQQGQRAISGGTSWSSDDNGEELVTVYSRPVMEKGVPVGWRARGGSDVGAARVFTVEVLCA
jgi:hypothetical protein